MSTRYLFISNKTGQLGNRLVVYAHMLAAARECGWTLLNPSFCEYAPYFTGTQGRLVFCGLPQANPPDVDMLERQVVYKLNRVGYQLSKILHRIPGSGVGWAKASNTLFFDLEELLQRAERKRWRALFTQNYHFRQHTWCAKHADYIRQVFIPIEPFRSDAETLVDGFRKPHTILVGVHIRHGDYQHHLGGKFFYSVAQYVALMRQMAAFLSPQPVQFLVCSNAKHTADDFAGLDVRFGPGHLVSDLHALSLCDWLFGPPSSFSAWAAFYGSARYHMVEDPERPLVRDDFAIPLSPDPRY